MQAKTDYEVIEHALMHQEMGHGVKELSPDLEKKMEENIGPVSADGISLGKCRLSQFSYLEILWQRDSQRYLKFIIVKLDILAYNLIAFEALVF